MVPRTHAISLPTFGTPADWSAFFTFNCEPFPSLLQPVQSTNSPRVCPQAAFPILAVAFRLYADLILSGAVFMPAELGQGQVRELRLRLPGPQLCGHQWVLLAEARMANMT